MGHEFFRGFLRRVSDDASITSDAARRGRSPTPHDERTSIGTALDRLRQTIAEEEFVLVVLLAAFGIVFLTVFPPTLLVADTWMTLLAGREIVENGLPSQEELHRARARPHVDRSAVGSAAHRIRRAFARRARAARASSPARLRRSPHSRSPPSDARSLGAGPRAIVLLFFPVLMAAPWTFTVRAQVFALPLYTGVLWLLASEARRPTRRVYLVLPLLVVWTNIHGSASLAALLTMLLGGDRARDEPRALGSAQRPPARAPAARASSRRRTARSTTARYYHLLLVDPPFGRELVTEWQRSDAELEDAHLLPARGRSPRSSSSSARRRLTLFDIGTLAVTFVGAVVAIRGIPWFALACLILLPVAIGRRARGPDAARAPAARRRALVRRASARSPSSRSSRSSAPRAGT